ncbi:MAG: DUF6186 family protein [Actinomycetota bacterium]
MNSRQAAVAVYAFLAAAGVALQVLSRRAGSPIPSLGAVLGRAMRTRSGRVGVLAGWLWLGLHFFAR